MEELNQENVELLAKKAFEKEPYLSNEKMLREVLNKMPYSTQYEHVYAKINLIDDAYSTRLNMHRKKAPINLIAERIVKVGEKLDALIKEGDDDAVTLILEQLPVNLFSFASKYCCLHNFFVYEGDAFSIYDSSVEEYFPYYAKQADYKMLSPNTLKRHQNYAAFNNNITEFLNKIHIDCKNRKRKFDLFLWYQRHNKS